mgnify:CR=1 FL=1
MPIRLLSDDVASQIAAGEVIERPASVVKELVENALDAGASQITVEIEGAGRQLIRVSDNGGGIAAEDVPLAFRAHATSKITSADDLVAVQTLGFRGEALASIAAVSRTQMITRSADETTGVKARVNGGQLLDVQPIGAPPGTVVSVESLFFNVPARLKFLKTDASERSQILRLVSRLAMGYPAVRFRLMFDGRLAFQTTGTGNLNDVLLETYGIEIARQLLPVRYGEGNHTVRVGGLISPPDVNRATRSEISVFVNRRWVQTTRLTTAAVQAYHALLPPNRYPIAVLMIDMPPEDVDVNVHPAKAEVRFRNDGLMFAAVERAVRQTLLADNAPGTYQPRQWEAPAEGWSPSPNRGWQTGFDLTPSAPRWDTAPAPADNAPAGAAPPAQPDASPAGQTQIDTGAMPLLRVIGQVGAAYIVAEGPDGLYLIDQYAAHSRVLFEAYLAQLGGNPAPAQTLLQPAAVELPGAAVNQIIEELPVLQALGFEIEPFGPGTVLVRGLPAVLGPVNATQAVKALVEDFEDDESAYADTFQLRLAARLSKRAAVRAGQVLTQQEQVALVQRLERCANPRACPHGRPTMIHISVDLLARQFGRR